MVMTLTPADLELNLTCLPAPDVPFTTRAMLGLRLASWHVRDELAREICLAAVELLTNACTETPEHEITFTARLNPQAGTIRVGVWDSSNGLPEPKTDEWTLESIDSMPDDYEFGGWGLALVMASSIERGIDKTAPTGKWVWALFKSA
jgi:anti-sigma regulatory factor (Ser/Thr protein kinase)